MTIKTQRAIRKRRRRVLMDRSGVFVPAKDVIRREPHALSSLMRWAEPTMEREKARRLRQIERGQLKVSA